MTVNADLLCNAEHTADGIDHYCDLRNGHTDTYHCDTYTGKEWPR